MHGLWQPGPVVMQGQNWLFPLPVRCIWFSCLHRLQMRSARLPSVSKANVPDQLVSCHPRCGLSRPCRAAKSDRGHWLRLSRF